MRDTQERAGALVAPNQASARKARDPFPRPCGRSEKGSGTPFRGVGLHAGGYSGALMHEELLAAFERVVGDVKPREGRADVDRPRVPPEEP